jgi:hypothetical protein
MTRAIKDILSRQPPLILAMVGLLIFGLGYSVMKMADAFNTTQVQPGYATMPPAALAPPVAETLVSAAGLGQARLPDDVYTQLATQTAQLAQSVAATTITANQLETDGMSASEAKQAVNDLLVQRPQFSGRKVQFSPPVYLAASGITSATMDAAVSYGASSTNSQDLSANVEFSYQENTTTGEWSLVNVQLQTAADQS